jgi:hypothetical protein
MTYYSISGGKAIVNWNFSIEPLLLVKIAFGLFNWLTSNNASQVIDQ